MLQHGRRYKMPQICELPKQTLPLIVINVTAQIMASRGKPNVQIIFLHPEFCMLALKTITDGLQKDYVLLSDSSEVILLGHCACSYGVLF